MADFKVLPAQEAVDFFRSKGLEPSFAWQDVWQAEHARAFTVAKAMSRDVLEDIRGMVDQAIADGMTQAEFTKQLKPMLAKRGWWGKRSMVDPLTGEQKIVQLGSPRRLKTIFEVNMRSAYAAGRWARAERVKDAFPFLRYVTAEDSKVRAEHRAWHGVVKPIGDPWWDTHYPPCGWSCRCVAVPVSGGMMERRGWEVTQDPPTYPDAPYLNPRTGEVFKIEQGIDPGFAFNVGKSYLEGLDPSPGGAVRPVSPAIGNAVAKSFASAFGTDQLMFDRSGYPVAAGSGWFRSPGGDWIVPDGFPASEGAAKKQATRIAATIADPDEIRELWRDGANGQRLWTRRYVWSGTTDIIVDVDRGGWQFVEGKAINRTMKTAGRLVYSANSRKPSSITPDGILRAFAWEASRKPDNDAVLDLGPVVSPSPADVQGFDRVARAAEIRHAMLTHGDAAIEQARGQVAISIVDIGLIPTIIANADSVVVHGATRGGRGQSISYKATLNRYRYTYVEIVGRKERRVSAKTLFKESVAK